MLGGSGHAGVLLQLQQNTRMPVGVLFFKKSRPAPALECNLRRVFFKVGDSYKPCPVEEVSFFFAANKLTHARVGQRSYPVNVQLKVLEDTFTNSFVRIHRTYLVNIAHIEAVNPREGTIHVAGETLPIGYAYRRDFMEGLRLMR